MLNDIRTFLQKYDISYPHIRFALRMHLSSMQDEDLIEEIGMADMPLLIYLLEVKYHTAPKLISICEGYDLAVVFGEKAFANLSYLALYLHFFSFENGILTIEGTTSYPVNILFDDFIIILGEEHKVLPLSDCHQDLYLGKNVYEKRQVFRVSLTLQQYTTIRFANRVGQVDVEYRRINSMRFAPIADAICNQYFSKDGWVFYIKDNAIVCTKANTETVDIFEKRFLHSIQECDPKHYAWVKELRGYYFAHCHHEKQIWLFMDRPERADDNARALFIYAQRFKEVDSYFLLNSNSLDFEEMSCYGRIVPIYSEEHYRLALVADYIISSQCNGLIENPFWEQAEYFRDLYHRPKMIFLQHGTIKDDMSMTLNRYNTNFSGFVTGTLAEYKSILDGKYFYTPKEVWLTGQPRYDYLYDASKKLILIMPSWRKELMEQRWDEDNHEMKWRLREGFEKSSFYKAYHSLISNQRLNRICSSNGYQLLLVLHPLMRECGEVFTRHTTCELTDSLMTYNRLFAEGSLLITDYSSVAFDFAYLGKPVIYYQFDRERFFRNHTYRKGYFKYELDGFGPVCTGEFSVLREIIFLISHDCQMQEPYLQRAKTIWPYHKDYCKRVCEKLMREKEDGKINKDE